MRGAGEPMTGDGGPTTRALHPRHPARRGHHGPVQVHQVKSKLIIRDNYPAVNNYPVD